MYELLHSEGNNQQSEQNKILKGTLLTFPKQWHTGKKTTAIYPIKHFEWQVDNIFEVFQILKTTLFQVVFYNTHFTDEKFEAIKLKYLTWGNLLNKESEI